MAASPAATAADRLERYVTRLRRRALWFQLLRALCACAGLSALGLLVAAAFAGPVVSPAMSRSALTALVVLALAALGVVLWPVRKLRGLGACALIAGREPALASRVRSALELRAAAPAGSAELVSAHARSVNAQVRALPAAEVVPWRGLVKGPLIAWIGCATLSGLLFLGNEPLRVGAGALLRPAALRDDGVRVAEVVERATARLVYPSYLKLPPKTLRDPSALQAPRGTTVELTVVPRMPAQQGLLLLGNAPTRLRGAPGGTLFGRFVVHDDAELRLRIADEGTWFEDARQRTLDALEDHKPEVELTDPKTPTVELHDRIPLRVHARDDHGLMSVELAVRVQDHEETRTRLWSSLNADAPQRKLDDETSLSPAEVGAQPGDTLLVWLEAHDGDTVSGPNVGVSKPLTFEVATDAQQLSLRLPQLREVLDGSLEALADRLETPQPQQSVGLAAQRVSELHAGDDAWLKDLDGLIAASRTQPDALDIDQLRGVLERMRHALARETALGRGVGRALRAFGDADARVVSEHERDVLLLADMLAQGLVDEARALAKELSGLKDHIAELLAELKKNPSPEAERAVLAEIAKAQRRLRELAQNLARLSNRVPSEFINREALPQSEAGNALEDLRSAVEAGDMGSAEAQLAALQREIDSLSDHLESGGTRFREAHFGAHDRALAEARNQLGMLAAEQERLSERTRDLVKRASERAQKRDGSGPPPELEHRADSLQRDLQALNDSSPGSLESPWLDRAQARMQDAADALRTGDVAEARRMAQSASSNLEQAANSLEQDARMFPGRNGETWQRARAANDAAQALDRLQQQLDKAMPDLGDAMGQAERAQLRGDVDAQQAAREKAEGLQSQLGADQGGQGMPLSPSGEQGLEQATEAMRRAEHALERGDGQRAALEQEDASERLRQVNEQLAQKGRGNRPGERDGGGGRRSESGDGVSGDPEGPVRIPGADEFSGPVQMRRRLLDAMREQAPNDYAPAIQHYYRELLR